MYGVNTLGSHAFAVELLPLLQTTARDSPKGTVRVISVASSAANNFAPKRGLDLASLDNPDAYMKKYNQWARYGMSKLVHFHTFE